MSTGEPAQVRAAGGVVARRRGDGLELLLVHRPRYDDWTLPKGKNDPGESDEDCALREVLEETGILCFVGQNLGTTEYRDSAGRPKVVRYFAMGPLAGSFTPHAEVDELAWLTPDEARGRLTYDRDLGLVDVALLTPAPLYLFRHADARGRQDWSGDDLHRPLDARGVRQAAALDAQLGEAPIERVVSSPYVRCTESVVPLAEARGLEIEEREELAEGRRDPDVRALIDELDGSPALLCTHGDILQALIGDPGEKGSTRIAVRAGATVRVVGALPSPRG